MVLDDGAGVVVGTIIPGDRPLSEDTAMTAMTGVTCAQRPFADAEFDTVRDADGKVEMQTITLVPVSSAEIALATEQGIDALFEIWERQETDLADLTDLARPSAV
jgi:hypothetical protein